MSHFQQRSSILSQTSRCMSQFINYIEELTDAELIKQVNDLKHQIKILTLENEIFEQTILRLEPSLMNGVQQAIEYAMKLQSNSNLGIGSFVKSQTSRFGMDTLASPSRMLASPSRMLTSPSKMLTSQSRILSSPSKMLASPSRISTRRVESSARIGGTIFSGGGPRINVLERSELVSTEMEIVVSTLDREKAKAAKQHALLKAELEEVGVRVVDIQKAVEAFNEEVLIDGWDRIAQRIPAEIWVRYMTEWVKIADSQIGKLRLRTSTLSSQFSRLKGQIRVKAELSESLRPVDFEKLYIENDEAQKLIDKKCHQLVELKQMTGEANLNLTVHKKAMMVQNNYLSGIKKTIKTRERQIKSLDKERDLIQIQVNTLESQMENIKSTRMAYEVPDIMDYVQVKSEYTDLMHSVKILENRIHIQQIALRSLNKKLQTMSGI